MRTIKLTAETKANLLGNLLKRSPNNYSEYESTVNGILEDVRKDGDRALFDYTLKFDRFPLSADNIKVTREEIDAAYGLMDDGLTASRPFSRRVEPVSTMSTMTSDRPTRGPSSTEPLSLMMSTV